MVQDAEQPAFNRELNLLSVDQVFQRIETTYYNPNRLRPAPDGIDWLAWKERVRGEVSEATSIDQVRSSISAALDALGESHFAILPGEVYENFRRDRGADAGANEPGSVGVHVRLHERLPIIAAIDRGSSAEAAGLRAGWVIERINDTDILAGVEELRAASGSRPLSDVRIIEWIESKLFAPVDSTIRLSLRSVNGQTREVRLASRRQPGLWASFGYLPAMNLRYSATRLPDEIGYFSLSVFLDPPRVMPVFGQFVRENLDARGIIIDLRGNPGGLGLMATGMCGFFIPEEGQRLGTMLRRDGNLQFVVNPRYPQYAGPVAVLVDGMSLSTSEILAGGLQLAGRARLFGQPTPGAALPSTIVRLANGDILQYALADFVLADGKRLEGVGITPDTVVPLDRVSLEGGRDDTLEAARQWILDASTKPATQPSGPTSQGVAAPVP